MQASHEIIRSTTVQRLLSRPLAALVRRCAPGAARYRIPGVVDRQASRENVHGSDQEALRRTGATCNSSADFVWKHVLWQRVGRMGERELHCRPEVTHGHGNWRL